MRFAINGSRSVARTLVVVVAVLCPSVAPGQKPPCKQNLVAVSGEAGYKDRTYGCEGFFVQPQANLNIQVLSLIQGPVRLDGVQTALIGVPELPDSLNGSALTVFGLGMTSGLNWALDGPARATQPMKWQLSTVVKGAGLDASSLGLVARTSSAARFATPWYVAVRVAPSPELLQAIEKQPKVSTELVVRIPAAAALQIWDDSLSGWKNAQAMDGDGRFKSVLPARWHRAQEVRIRWRPRGTNKFGDVETLRVWLW